MSNGRMNDGSTCEIPQIHFSIAQPLSYLRPSILDYSNKRGQDVPVSTSCKPPGDGSEKQECEHGISQKPKVSKIFHHPPGSYSVSAPVSHNVSVFPVIWRGPFPSLSSLLPNQCPPSPSPSSDSERGNDNKRSAVPSMKTSARHSEQQSDDPTISPTQPIVSGQWHSRYGDRHQKGKSKGWLSVLHSALSAWTVQVPEGCRCNATTSLALPCPIMKPAHISSAEDIRNRDVSSLTRSRLFDRRAAITLSFAWSTARPTPNTPLCPAPKPGRDSGYPTEYGPRQYGGGIMAVPLAAHPCQRLPCIIVCAMFRPPAQVPLLHASNSLFPFFQLLSDS
ncbi:hypothetical protein BDP55DRAFT_636469 [Colletotrichum godetiae]|uniref:Uncharacterized protein n=1 Tax=Colletotrichum godetiae TaxID=1209918 RepID=A0AAJ0EPQ9_9PEZI|nr:uncharacterized protein BDP55DRAFT_636469 [Colletotrichum godetiae]KAK1659986.1 hypothetical protein BDP55DRAFT_636469 [Colletotrichum godetiae]